MDVDPLPTGRRLTTTDLARGFNQLHKCLHATSKDVSQIKDALGLDKDGKRVKKVAALSTNFQSWIRTLFATTSSIVSVALFYKLLMLALPGLVAIWMAVSTAALHGVF